MTSWQFHCVLDGDPAWFEDGEKCRYPVAEAMRARAKHWRDQGRPDRAGRLSWAASEVAHGGGLSKKLRARLRTDLDAIAAELVGD
jgi:hypothetical protein